MRFARASAILVLAASAALVAGPQLLLFAAPLLLIGVLLVSGRFVGEERILAWRAARLARRVRRARAGGWGGRPAPAAPHVFLCSSRRLRGPPALAGA